MSTLIVLLCLLDQKLETSYKKTKLQKIICLKLDLFYLAQ